MVAYASKAQFPFHRYDFDRWPVSRWLLRSLGMKKPLNFNPKWRLRIKDSYLKLVILSFSLLKLANSLANFLPEMARCSDVFEFLLCFSRTSGEFLCNRCPAVQYLVLLSIIFARLIVETVVFWEFLPWKPQYWMVWNAFWDSRRSLRSLESGFI